jgi:DNA-nicking Smr family endonuclease
MGAKPKVATMFTSVTLGQIPRLRSGRTAATNNNSQNTLDGSWDKRLRLGQAAPDFTIDLHGETLSSAHARLNRSLAAAIRSEARIILLITGRPAKDNPRLPPTSRGVIRATVGDWLAASPYASHIAAVRGAHPRHGGAGALYLILRRAR